MAVTEHLTTVQTSHRHPMSEAQAEAFARAVCDAVEAVMGLPYQPNRWHTTPAENVPREVRVVVYAGDAHL